MSENITNRIILCERDLCNRRTLARVLTSSGFTVDCFPNGHVASTKSVPTKEGIGYHLLIANSVLLDMQGVQLLYALRDKYPGLPGIIINDRPMPNPSFEDAIMYVNKPVRTDFLAEQAQKLITTYMATFQTQIVTPQVAPVVEEVPVIVPDIPYRKERGVSSSDLKIPAFLSRA